MASAPYLRRSDSVFTLDLDLLFALAPAMAGAVCAGGWHAYALLFLGAGVCALLSQTAARLRGELLPDYGFDALLTGLLFVLTLPAGAPLWSAAAGAALAAAVGELSRRTGLYLLPAAAARLLLLPVLPAAPPASSFLWGAAGGAMGDFAGIFLLLGAAYLAARRLSRKILQPAFLLSAVLAQLPFGSGLSPMGGLLPFAALCLLPVPGVGPMTPLGQLLAGVLFGALAGLSRGVGFAEPGVLLCVLGMGLLRSRFDGVGFFFAVRRMDISAQP